VKIIPNKKLMRLQARIRLAEDANAQFIEKAERRQSVPGKVLTTFLSSLLRSLTKRQEKNIFVSALSSLDMSTPASLPPLVT